MPSAATEPAPAAEHLHSPGLGSVQRWLSNWVVQTGALAVLSNASPPGTSPTSSRGSHRGRCC